MPCDWSLAVAYEVVSIASLGLVVKAINRYHRLRRRVRRDPPPFVISNSDASLACLAEFPTMMRMTTKYGSWWMLSLSPSPAFLLPFPFKATTGTCTRNRVCVRRFWYCACSKALLSSFPSVFYIRTSERAVRRCCLRFAQILALSTDARQALPVLELLLRAPVSLETSHFKTRSSRQTASAAETAAAAVSAVTSASAVAYSGTASDSAGLGYGTSASYGTVDYLSTAGRSSSFAVADSLTGLPPLRTRGHDVSGGSGHGGGGSLLPLDDTDLGGYTETSIGSTGSGRDGLEEDLARGTVPSDVRELMRTVAGPEFPLSPVRERFVDAVDVDLHVYVLEALGVASFRSGNIHDACHYLEACLSVATGTCRAASRRVYLQHVCSHTAVVCGFTGRGRT